MTFSTTSVTAVEHDVQMLRDDAQPRLYRDTSHFLESRPNQAPVLLFSQAELASSVETFFSGFSGTTSYAVKANPDAHILSALFALGVEEFDAASIGEISLLRSLLPRAHINFNNPIRSVADLHSAYHDFRVRSFVVDDAAALTQLEALACTDIEVTVRLKLAHENAAYDFGSKFGASVSDATALLLRLKEHANFDRVSMAFHPGSQCTSADVYEKYIESIAAVARSANTTLSRLNVGGGFPLQYANTNLPPVTEYFAAITETAQRCFEGDVPPLVCEPGRALVGTACSVVCEVIHVRDNGDVFISDGVYGSLQEQFLMDSRLPVKVWRNGRQLELTGAERDIFGPTCDPSDKLTARYQLVDEITPGDKLEFGLMGAYSSATSTRFNGIEPAEYALVRDGFYPR